MKKSKKGDIPMAYCENCGTRIEGDAKICSGCATGGRGVEPNVNQMNYQQEYVGQNNNSQYYGAPNQGSYPPPTQEFYSPQSQYSAQSSEKATLGWGFLGCCIPIVGLILYFVWKKDRPRTSKIAGIGALIGIGLLIISIILSILLGFLSEANSTQSGSKGVTNQSTEVEESLDSDFTEIVVVDNEECVIKITGIEEDDIWGYVLNATLENKSNEKTYTYIVDNAAVNGVDVDSLFYIDVTPGNKSNEEIIFSKDEIGAMGIDDEITDIELSFRVYDADNWGADDVVYETINVYPYGEENAVKYVREQQPTDDVIVDNEYATIIVTGYETDDIWGYTANMYIVNKTENEMMVSIDDVSVNGYMLDPFYADSISAGNSSFSSFSWDEADLADNNIATVDEIKFTLEAYNFNDIFADSYIYMNVVLNP